MKRTKGYLLLLLVLVLGACSTDHGSGGNYSDSTDRLEVVSWWVSPSEKPAFQSLLDAFKKANPDVTDVVDGSIAGGGGSNVHIALAERLRAGDPPDVWQTFLGASLQSWASANRIVDVSGLYQRADLQSHMPGPLFDAATDSGKQWGVPTGAHRGNNLWFNVHALQKAGIATPGQGYTAEQFVADLRKAKDAGVTPLCLGAKDRFTSVELFENTLLGVIGADGWTKIHDDRFDWTGSELKTTLSTFADVVSEADPAAGGLTWDQAAKKFAAGDCAFLSMNDSVYGELIANKVAEGTDFGWVAYPGTSGNYLAITDTFVAAAGAKDGVNAMKFLETVASPETALEFNKLKGSVPIRNDVDVSSLPAYQRDASKALWNDKILMSITHGELMGTAFQQGLYDAVSAYVTSKDQKAFIDTLQQAVVVPVAGR